MNCAECLPILNAYVDDELDVRASLEMEAHLQGCETCAARQGELRQLSRTVRANASRFAPSAEFEEKLRARLRAELAPAPVRPARPAWFRRAGLAVQLVAALALAWTGGVWWERRGVAHDLTAEVFQAHVRSLLGDHLVDVESSDRHTVNPWFQGKLPFAVGARDHAADGFALAGGRLDYLAGQPVAALVYRHGPHAINEFVWPAGSASTEPVREFEARGYSSRAWVQDGMNHWLVSDVDPSALAQLVELVRAEK